MHTEAAPFYARLVSKDPLRPSTYNMMQADAEFDMVVLAGKFFHIILVHAGGSGIEYIN